MKASIATLFACLAFSLPVAADVKRNSLSEHSHIDMPWKNKVTKEKSKGLSAIHILGILVFGGIAAILIFGESDSKKRDRLENEYQITRMEKISNLAKQYYGKREVIAGTFGVWKIKSITPHADNPFSKNINTIDVRVEVNRKVAKEILWRSSEGQHRAASNGCPPISHEIYKVMTNNDNLTLQVEVDGNVFIDVDCARWAGNIGAP